MSPGYDSLKEMVQKTLQSRELPNGPSKVAHRRRHKR